MSSPMSSPEPCFFLEEDFDKFLEEMRRIDRLLFDIGQEMGASCVEGAETFHDNFAYEDGERLLYMWSRRLVDFQGIKRNARIVKAEETNERVTIGKRVRYKNLDTEATREVIIGSFMNFVDKENKISYRSPLAKILIGGRLGDTREGEINGQECEFEILEIK